MKAVLDLTVVRRKLNEATSESAGRPRTAGTGSRRENNAAARIRSPRCKEAARELATKGRELAVQAKRKEGGTVGRGKDGPLTSLEKKTVPREQGVKH